MQLYEASYSFYKPLWTFLKVFLMFFIKLLWLNLWWSWRATILFHHFHSSSSVFVQHSRISQIVISELLNSSEICQILAGSVKQFLEISKCSRKFQALLAILGQFSELFSSSSKSQKVFISIKPFWNFETVLGSVRKFLEVPKSCRKSKKIIEASNSSQKFQTVLGKLKQFSMASMSCSVSKKLIRIFKKLLVLGGDKQFITMSVYLVLIFLRST